MYSAYLADARNHHSPGSIRSHGHSMASLRNELVGSLYGVCFFGYCEVNSSAEIVIGRKMKWF